MWEHQLIHHTSPQCTVPVVGTAAWSRTTANPCSYPTPALSTQVKSHLCNRLVPILNRKHNFKFIILEFFMSYF